MGPYGFVVLMMFIGFNVLLGSYFAFLFLVFCVVTNAIWLFVMLVPSDSEPLFSQGMSGSVHTLITLDVVEIDRDDTDADSINIFLNRTKQKVRWKVVPDLDLLEECPLLYLSLNQTRLYVTSVSELIGGTVELSVAPISGNFFSIQEQDQVWKYIKFKLRQSIDKELKTLGSGRGALSPSPSNSLLRKRFLALLDPVVHRSTAPHNEEHILNMNQALIVDCKGNCRVQLAVDDIIATMKDRAKSDVDLMDQRAEFPSLHRLVNDCLDKLVASLANEVGFMCSLYNPQDSSLALQRPKWLYVISPDDNAVQETTEEVPEA